MRAAFYAPMKAPNHPTPSGDRRMARLLMAALEQAGYRVDLASDLRCYDAKGDPVAQATSRSESEAVANALVARWREGDADERPDLWFTYHVYHKAPDWLGPAVVDALAIPYAIAEASHAPKRRGGPWDLGYRAAEAAIARADVVYAMTRLDSACLRPLVTPPHKLHYLPPFLDAADEIQADRDALALRFGLDADVPWLLAVAMMRPGDKLASYRELAAALGRLDDVGWQLLVVGGGPARGDVEALMAGLEERVRFCGVLHGDHLESIYAAADLYVWPGVGEAYGMAFLEAQSQGTPVVATDRRGIPDVVRAGTTGLLVREDDPAAFAGAIRKLLNDTVLREGMADAARNWVRADRSLSATARLLERTLP